jgi:D-3-phosphoglycerate dehydrogenase / 2-oxoglutarate reductase
MAKEVAIIGDYFMLPEVFEEKVREACGDAVSIRVRKDNWPDEPMAHGHSYPGMECLKEYFGSADGVIDFVGDAEILVTHLAPVSRKVLERLPALRMVAVSRGGPVNIDMKAARDFNVLVVNAPGRNSTAVAEFTIGAILAETRKIRVGHEALRVGTWRGDLYRADVTGRELNELTVGVIGYGNIGTKVVKLLRAFGARILVNDPYVQLSAEDIAAGVKLADFDTILVESDVVTMHARVTKETTGMMNAGAFARMKSGSLFVNTARGPLCDYAALYEALVEGPLGAAMLETFGVEPVPADWPLLQLPNVTLTPHIAGASVRTVTFAAEQAAEEVRRYLAGEGPRNPC